MGPLKFTGRDLPLRENELQSSNQHPTRSLRGIVVRKLDAYSHSAVGFFRCEDVAELTCFRFDEQLC